MARIHALTAAFGAAALLAVLAVPAAAAPPPASNHTLTSAEGDVVVHYYTGVITTTDQPEPDYTSETEAGDVAAWAEQAYKLFKSWYPSTVPAHYPIDIYLQDLPDDYSSPSLEAYVEPSSGNIFVTTPRQMASKFLTASGLTLAQEEQKAVANEIFVLFEFAHWVPANVADYWLIDSAAQWAAFEDITPLATSEDLGTPTAAAVANLGPPDIAVDCRDKDSPLPPPAPALPFRMCDPARYVELGYTRWAFWRLLANKWGPTFLTSALDNGALGQSATTALGNAIAAKSSSLASVFNEYAADLMNANFNVLALSAIRPPAYAKVVVGAQSTGTPRSADPLHPNPVQPAVVTVPVNHLSARYVTYQRGDGSGSHACYAATLSISVDIPAGTSAQPYFYWDTPGSTPQALSISGSKGSIDVPWDTCDWGTTRGWLSVPNAGTSVDAARFTVTSSVSVTGTPVNASKPPDPATVWGTPVPVPTLDVPPSIDVFGPELLQLSAKSPTIRLIVSSSGTGMVNATLGATTLGSRTLRGGNNDLRFTVPKSLLSGLRRAATANDLLTLTPMSTSGSAAGQAVTRHVVIASASKAKTKKKKK
jgi:hypothetical protein